MYRRNSRGSACIAEILIWILSDDSRKNARQHSHSNKVFYMCAEGWKSLNLIKFIAALETMETLLRSCIQFSNLPSVASI